MTLAKVCPKCGFHNDLAEMYCAGETESGTACGFSVAMVTPTLPHRPTDDSAPEATAESTSEPTPTAEERVCQNGHVMDPFDAVCIECGADPEESTSEPSSSGNGDPTEIVFGERYRVLRPIEPIEGVAECYLAQRIGDATSEANVCDVLVHHYLDGIVPSDAVQDILQSIDASGITRLQHCGEQAGRAFEIYEYLPAGTLADLPRETTHRLEFVRELVVQISTALDTLHQAALLHRDLKPINLQVRSVDPLQLTIANFAAAAVAELEIQVTSTLQTTRYAAPESFAGISSTASDWWSLGVILLDLLSGGTLLEDIDDRAFQLLILTRPIPIPEQLDDDWQLLLKGLLTRDHTRRWGGEQVAAWLRGEPALEHHFEADHGIDPPGSEIELGGASYSSPSQYALAAATTEQWPAAVVQLDSGQLGTWLADKQFGERELADWNAIQEDHTLSIDQQLMLGLLLMNPQLPLCYRGEIVSPLTFASTAARSVAWLENSLASHLMRLNRELWFVDLAERRDAAQTLAHKRGVPQIEARVDALSLIPDGQQLRQHWIQRQAQWPEPRHSTLLHLVSKKTCSEPELLVLLAAPLTEFRSADEILAEASGEAKAAGVTGIWDPQAAAEMLRHGRRAVFQTLSDRLTDFVRCGHATVDQWADTFRFEHRISIARSLVLLCIPESQWIKPAGGEHWRLLLNFFRRKVLASVQRGPLLSLTIRKNSPRIDIDQLGSETIPATEILDALLSSETSPSRIDPGLLERDTVLQRRLRRLRNNSEGYQRDTGISSLYLGFPFLIRRDPESRQIRPRYSPLLLWPVKLDYPAGQHTSLRISADRDQDRVRLNPALGVLFSAERKQQIHAALLEIQSRDSITTTQLMELLQPLFCRDDEQLCDVFDALPAEPQLPDQIACRVVASGVIFQCDFAGQELADELDKLQNLPFDGSPAAALMRLERQPSDVSSETPTAQQRFLVTEADPSQEAAVYAARTGPGLLIQGPPGTGKSQTIVNIVADAMGRGQTVLVVCQKQAALEVVGHRLESEGLGKRTVMIGDPSRDRRPFLERLRNELSTLRDAADRPAAAAVHRAKATEVSRLETELDRVHETMTQLVLNSGLTYEQILGKLVKLANDPSVPSVPELRPLLRDVHHVELHATADQIEQITPLWLQANFEHSPLHALKSFSPDRETIAIARQALDRFVASESKRQQEIDTGKAAVEIDHNDMPALAAWFDKHSQPLAATPEAILKPMRHWVDLFDNGVAQGERHRLDGIAAAADANRAPESELRLRSKMSGLSDTEITSLRRDSETVRRLHASWFRHVWPPYYRSVGRLSSFYETEPTDMTADIQAIHASLKYESAARTGSRRYEKSRAKLLLRAPAVNLSSQQLAAKVRELIASLRSAQTLIDRGQTCPRKTAFFESLKTGEPRRLRNFLETVRQGVHLHTLREHSQHLLRSLEPWFDAAWIELMTKSLRSEDGTSTQTAAIISAWDSVISFQTFRLRVATIPMLEQSLLASLSQSRAAWEAMPAEKAASSIAQTVIREALLGWRAAAEEASPWLLLDRDEFEDKVQRLDRASEELKSCVAQMLPALPAPDQIARRSRWDDILMYTGPRAKKLRETVDMGRELGLYQMRPIWLANPDTVSRIFPLQAGLFDVVVFDEASQLPVEYALPAIYRGKTIIVSGDEKQLPPPKFFAAAFEDDDEEIVDSDDESEEAIERRSDRREVKDCSDLLELASPVFPTVMLNVHYRSRFRQLIDYSNAAYYENRLSVPVLHPLEKITQLRPIEFFTVDGVYENQVNEIEADRVVAALQGFWNRDAGTSIPTIGVVTFNLKQAELIEDKLELLAEEDRAFRDALTLQRNRTHEGERCGFFVKNVESVQGDERDCMIFSTTFGKNAKGTFRRNFGALGQVGGERRLNVATTRAKHQMQIFSSMPLERISDLRQSLVAPQTPRDFLQAYMMYAKAVSDARYEEAQQILTAFGSQETVPRQQLDLIDSFVKEVHAFLTSAGYDVVVPPAQGAFRFDLAIRGQTDGMYAIAIECDSPQHHDLRFARHRELWRREVLKATIPAIHRVWSRMWLIEPEAEQHRLIEAIKKAMVVR